MKVVRFDNGPIANRREYETDRSITIDEAVAIYGRTEDTLELYGDDGELIALATWPQGRKIYKFCTGKNLDPNPAWRIWRDHNAR